MKKIVTLLIFLFLLSCSMDVIKDFSFNEEFFSSFPEACKWININIEYKYYDKTHSPQTTLEKKKGDCADMSVLLMAIMGYQHKIYSSEYIRLWGKHSVVRYNGEYYDCTLGTKLHKLNAKIKATYNYYQTMELAYREEEF